MTDNLLAETIIQGVRNNAQNLQENGVALDGRFIKELSQALFATATVKGLDPDLAMQLRRTTLETVADRLGL